MTEPIPDPHRTSMGAAKAMIRKASQRAEPGPWRIEGHEILSEWGYVGKLCHPGDPGSLAPNLAYMALLDPTVGELLADLLEAIDTLGQKAIKLPVYSDTQVDSVDVAVMFQAARAIAYLINVQAEAAANLARAISAQTVGGDQKNLEDLPVARNCAPSDFFTETVEEL